MDAGCRVTDKGGGFRIKHIDHLEVLDVCFDGAAKGRGRLRDLLRTKVKGWQAVGTAMPPFS